MRFFTVGHIAPTKAACARLITLLFIRPKLLPPSDFSTLWNFCRHCGRRFWIPTLSLSLARQDSGLPDAELVDDFDCCHQCLLGEPLAGEYLDQEVRHA
jgi:hypothetical protein